LNFSLQPLGTIHSPFKELVNMPVQPKGAKEHYATIEFKREYQEGLKDLSGFSHLSSEVSKKRSDSRFIGEKDD